MSRTVLLASASISRFSLLQSAGITPLVQVSYVDEDAIAAKLAPINTADLCLALATAKGEAVADNITVTQETALLVIAADSILEFEGQSLGKPGSPEIAMQRWKQMRGKSGYLHTGHWMKDTVTGQVRSGLAGAEVEFADISDAEIVAYVASGEPLSVAGGFTHEGKSAAFINRMTGDSPAVGGISLALLRKFALDMIIEWTQLWDL